MLLPGRMASILFVTFQFMNWIETFETTLLGLHAPVLNYFAPGLDDEEIRLTFDAAGLVPTDDLVALYRWHNGLHYNDVENDRINFGLPGIFLPLDSSIELYLQLDTILPALFPIVSGDSLLVDLDPHSPAHGRIYFFSAERGILPESRYDSLQKMFETLTVCFQEGIYSYDGESRFREIPDLAGEVWRSFNPACVKARESGEDDEKEWGADI